jgi:hypothetical protein
MTNKEKVDLILKQDPDSYEFKLNFLKKYLIKCLQVVEDELNPDPYYGEDNKTNFYFTLDELASVMHMLKSNIKSDSLSNQHINYILTGLQNTHKSIKKLVEVQEDFAKINPWHSDKISLDFNISPSNITKNYNSLDILLKYNTSKTSTTIYTILSITTIDSIKGSVFINDDFYKLLEDFDKEITQKHCEEYILDKLNIDLNKLRNIDFDSASFYAEDILRYFVNRVE